MYDDEKKFSKRHWYGLLFLMIVLGIFALRQNLKSEDAETFVTPQEAAQPSAAEDIYPEFAMMYDTNGNPGALRVGTTTILVNGELVRRMPVTYRMVNGHAVYEGDILLSLDGPRTAGVGINKESYLWPDGVIPYTIDSRLPNQERISDAIAHWEENTPFRFVQRTDDNASEYPNYVNFVPAQGCASYVGMQGDNNARLRAQPIYLGSACSTGNTIHEIGHAIGIWHEQSREDRDDYVNIRYENIISAYRHNFDKQIEHGVDLGDYDYGSIMHYPRWAFSKNGEDTIVPRGGQEIGQRDGLSQGDIDAVLELYSYGDPVADNHSAAMSMQHNEFDCYPGH